MSAIFAPVQTAKITNPDGTPTSQFILLFNQLLNRSGGILGGSYNSLENNAGQVIWDLNAAPIAELTLTNGNNTINAPLNQVAGAPPYRLTLVQPAGGSPSGTVTWANPPFVFPGGVAPTLSTGNNAVDILSFVSDGTNMYLITEGLNYSA